MNMAPPASDADRRRVLAVLERHTTAGRLRVDDFDQRVTTTLHAMTLDDLAAVTNDLPDEQLVLPNVDDQPRAKVLRLALWALATVIAALGVLFAVTR